MMSTLVQQLLLAPRVPPQRLALQTALLAVLLAMLLLVELLVELELPVQLLLLLVAQAHTLGTLSATLGLELAPTWPTAAQLWPLARLARTWVQLWLISTLLLHWPSTLSQAMVKVCSCVLKAWTPLPRQ